MYYIIHNKKSPKVAPMGSFAYLKCLGGEVVITPELQKDYTTKYIFVKGVAGIIFNYFRPEPKASFHYLSQKRDEQGNFC